MPTASVIIPVYNRGRWIEGAIRSVLAQTYRDFELIVVDDGSTDDTEARVAEFGDQRLRLIRHPINRGAQAARNTGIRAAAGRYIGFLDSDDEWVPDKLHRQITALDDSREVVGVAHGSMVLRLSSDSQRQRFRIPPWRGNIYTKVLVSPGPVFPTLLVRRECFDRIGFLDEAVPAYQEWETVIRLAKYYEFEWVDGDLAVYNMHTEEAISNDLARNAAGYLYVVTKHRAEIERVCGRSAAARHFRRASLFFLQADRTAEARRMWAQAIELAPLQLRVLALAPVVIGGSPVYRSLALARRGMMSLLARLRRLVPAAANRSD